jgi:replication factor C subunit 2/4
MSSFFAPSSSSANATGTSGTSSYEAPWIEKYRPELLTDIVGNSEAVERLTAIAHMGNLPNIILTGPPGIGKTTSILCLAREMLGKNYREAVLELNASDARGIDVVRGKIKAFAQRKVTLPPGMLVYYRNCCVIFSVEFFYFSIRQASTRLSFLTKLIP